MNIDLTFLVYTVLVVVVLYFVFFPPRQHYSYRRHVGGYWVRSPHDGWQQCTRAEYHYHKNRHEVECYEEQK